MFLMAIFYLNQGIILEQAISSLIHEYLETVDIDGLYKNFHVEVSNSHPFASLYVHANMKAADLFPAIIVSTQSDDKTSELSQLPADIDTVGLNENDIDILTSNTYGEDFIDMSGETRKAGTKIPGLCAVTSKKVIQNLKEIIAIQGYVYGYDIKTRRTDRVGIEIWADNEQVKNELYEIVRLFVSGGLLPLLQSRYKNFDISIFDHSIHGQRSGNHNMDFDIPLSGSSISFEVNYCIRQVLVDTEITKINEVIPEVKDYVQKI